MGREKKRPGEHVNRDAKSSERSASPWLTADTKQNQNHFATDDTDETRIRTEFECFIRVSSVFHPWLKLFVFQASMARADLGWRL
jgi:hypothetical protein